MFKVDGIRFYILFIPLDLCAFADIDVMFPLTLRFSVAQYPILVRVSPINHFLLVSTLCTTTISFGFFLLD